MMYFVPMSGSVTALMQQNETKTRFSACYKAQNNMGTWEYVIRSTEKSQIERSSNRNCPDSDCRVFLGNNSPLHVAARDLGTGPL